MKIIFLLPFLIFLNALAASAAEPDAKLKVRLEAKQCFYVLTQISCHNLHSDYNSISIPLQLNTVPNPYGSTGWTGTWQGQITDDTVTFFASIQISLERIENKSRYVISSQIWKDPKLPIANEIILDDLAKLPETTLLGMQETKSDSSVLIPRLSLKSDEGAQ